MRLIRSLLLLGLFVLATSPPTLRAEQPKVLVMGDSISAAYGMDIEQGWVHLWASSISGETTAGGLSRLAQLLTQHQPRLVIIELGGNDGLRGYPLPQIERNLSAMVELSQSQGADVVIIPMQIPPNYGAAYTQQFYRIYATVSDRYKATLTPFFLEDVALQQDLMQSDGIHPTATAQPIMLDAIRATLDSAIERAFTAEQTTH
jgi:acyl-CoA thioesterase I